ncbi:hypothetical protein D6D01_09836 [Aureobasidium pullulans]|uniref:PD-(D/E)XK nuclease-like domain-containing protein n=1 Tax=Aureobasidium pullulans TaxID=5580 RepID=A0A4S9JWW3_AURPU|nr:hypothetical protein D6D01_09836 [Aureobasidium pullulans]
MTSKRPRHHYPTPGSDSQEEQEQKRQREDNQEKEQEQQLGYTQSPTTVARKATRTALIADTEAVDEANAEQTPRAPRLTNLNILSTAASPVSSASTTTTSDSGATKRSHWSSRSSPSKHAVLSSLIQPITFPVLVKDTVPPNAAAGVRQLYDRLRQFERSQGVFPAAEQHLFAREGIVDPDIDLPYVYFDNTHYRATLGGVSSLADVDKLVKRVRKFRELGESEAAWNGYIDTTLFLLAEAASVHQGRTASTNTGKMVDFALVLEDSDALRAAAARLPINAGKGVFSFNHTTHSPLLRRPIAVSIETKRQGEHFQDALDQLGVWTSAHFARLTELLTAAGRSHVRPPMLPCLIAQGSDWKFILAEKTLAGEVKIWSKLDFGDVATHRGVYTTISVLLLLMDRAETQYRPWFEENICSSVLPTG